MKLCFTLGLFGALLPLIYGASLDLSILDQIAEAAGSNDSESISADNDGSDLAMAESDSRYSANSNDKPTVDVENKPEAFLVHLKPKIGAKNKRSRAQFLLLIRMPYGNNYDGQDQQQSPLQNVQQQESDNQSNNYQTNNNQLGDQQQQQQHQEQLSVEPTSPVQQRQPKPAPSTQSQAPQRQNSNNNYEPPRMDRSKNTYNGIPPSPVPPKVFNGRGRTFGGYGNSHTGAPAGGFGTAPQLRGRRPPGLTLQGRPATGSMDPFGMLELMRFFDLK